MKLEEYHYFHSQYIDGYECHLISDANAEQKKLQHSSGDDVKGHKCKFMAYVSEKKRRPSCCEAEV